MDVIETPISGRDLEALAIETYRTVGTALLALDLDAEGGAQRIAPRTFASDVRAGQIPLHRRRTELTMHGAVIFLGHPRLGRDVQLLERESGLPFEHGQKASLHATPDIFLLTVHMRRVRQGGQMQNPQVMKTGGELTRDHRRAPIGHERARQAHLLQRLAQAVDQLFGALARVPLGMAQEPRAVVDEADPARLEVLAAAGQDLARAVMEVKMDELQYVLDFVAA